MARDPVAGGRERTARVVQALLRLSGILLTADTYAGVLPCLAQQAAEVTEGPGPTR